MLAPLNSTTAGAVAFSHFAKNGAFLQNYDADRSTFVRTLFYTDCSELTNSPTLGDHLRRAGINAMTTGFYRNPADDDSVRDFATWRRRFDVTFRKITDCACKYDLSVVLTGDDIARSPKELSESISVGWHGDAINYAFTQAQGTGRVVCVEMIDEVQANWGDTPKPMDGRWRGRTPPIPDDAFVRLMGIIDRVPNRLAISWPVTGNHNRVAQHSWLADRSIADYSSILCDTADGTPDSQHPPPLRVMRQNLDEAVLWFQGQMQKDKPFLMQISICGPFYTKCARGNEFTPRDTLQSAGPSAVSIPAQIWYGVARGAAGIRAYSYDWSGWKKERASSPLGTRDLQTGSDPFTVGTDRWAALSAACNLVQQLEPHILQPRILASDLGPAFVTDARQGPDSRLLIAVNFCDSQSVALVDVSPYLYPTTTSVVRYRLVGSSLKIDHPPPVAAGGSIGFEPGEIIVWLFKP